MSFAEPLSLFYAALAVSLPTFGWVVLGVVLARLGLLPPALNDRLSRFAFKIGLPVMLFCGAARVDYSALSSARYLLAGVLATFLVLAVSWNYSRWRQHPRALRGIFVQAAFRSNLAIVGVALTYSAYGQRGPVLAALPIALMTVLYNIIAVWVLHVTLGASTTAKDVVLGILRNPLIIGISAGVCLSVSGLPQPDTLALVGAALSKFFLPLVLVCIGAAMDVSRLYRAGALTWEASVWRLCIAPLLGVSLALALGVRDEALGVLFLLIASPVAASSHVMVVAARGDGTLAANIVVLTTLLSLVTITLGFFILSMLGLVGRLH
ncbi:MAG: AEC family transporter [Halioglobus sp.]